MLYHHHPLVPAQALCVFVNQDTFPQLSAIDFLALWFAGLIHDYDHPGVNNKYLIETHHPVASVCNDNLVLENYHSAMAFRILLEGPHFMDFLKREEFLSFRHHVVGAVLATDLGLHFEYVKLMNSELEKRAADGEKEKLSPKTTMAIALKAADISHCLRPNRLHEEWSRRITAEFYAQGDMERALGLAPVSLMDREDDKASQGKSQMGFINFVAKPLLNPWCKLLDTGDMVAFCEENLRNWEALLDIEMTMATDLH